MMKCVIHLLLQLKIVFNCDGFLFGMPVILGQVLWVPSGHTRRIELVWFARMPVDTSVMTIDYYYYILTRPS